MSSSPSPSQGGILLEAKGLAAPFTDGIGWTDVSFEVREGSFHALVGEIGSGSGVLAEVLAGRVRPTGGSLSWEGRAVASFPVQEVEVVPRGRSLFLPMTVLENLALAGRPSALRLVDFSGVVTRAREVMAALGLDLPLEAPVRRLPSLPRALLGIVRALMPGPRLLVLDLVTEILSETDSESLLQVARQIQAGGAAVLLVTHRVREAMDFADRLTVLREGITLRTFESGSLDEESLRALVEGRESLSMPDPAEALKAFGVSTREAEIIRLLVTGLSNYDMAVKLDISANTVKTHIYGIYRKTGVKNRMELTHLMRNPRPRVARLP